MIFEIEGEMWQHGLMLLSNRITQTQYCPEHKMEKMLEENDYKTRLFEFELINREFQVTDNQKYLDYLNKWDMKCGFYLKAFKFQRKYNILFKDRFFNELFSSKAGQENITLMNSSHQWVPIPKDYTRIEIEKTLCTVTSLEFFDHLKEKNIVRHTGSITKCLEEYEQGFCIADELRKMFLVEDSDAYCVYNEKEREEFLFKLFQHICLGGGLCQYEDNIEPYIDVAKTLYKDLVTVRKHPTTKEIRIISDVFKIRIYNGSIPEFPSQTLHEQDFAYFVVNPSDGDITVLYNKWTGA